MEFQALIKVFWDFDGLSYVQFKGQSLMNLRHKKCDKNKCDKNIARQTTVLDFTNLSFFSCLTFVIWLQKKKEVLIDSFLKEHISHLYPLVVKTTDFDIVEEFSFWLHIHSNLTIHSFIYTLKKIKSYNLNVS